MFVFFQTNATIYFWLLNNILWLAAYKNEFFLYIILKQVTFMKIVMDKIMNILSKHMYL